MVGKDYETDDPENISIFSPIFISEGWVLMEQCVFIKFYKGPNLLHSKTSRGDSKYEPV